MARIRRDGRCPTRWRWPLLLLLLLLGACGRASDQRPPYEAAEEALRRGAIDEALSHVDRGVTAIGADRNTPAAHGLRLLRAEILLAKPDVAGASALLDASIPDGAEFQALQPRIRYVQARLEIARGQLKQALSTLESIDVFDHEQDVDLDVGVLAGQALLRLGRLDEGERRLRTTLEAAERRGDRYRQMLALNNLGMRFVNQRRVDEALPWFNRVIAFTDLEDTSVYAFALNNAGACYARLGLFEQALNLQQRSVALQERRGTAGPYGQAVGELGATYLLMEDVPRAVPFLAKALKIALDANLRTDAALAARNLAAAHVHIEQWEEAARFNEQARMLAPPDAADRVSFSTIHAADIARGRGNTSEAIRLFRHVLAQPEVEPALRWAAHDGLAGIARLSGHSNEAAAQFEAALQTLERTRADLSRTEYRLSFANRITRFYQTYVNLLIEQGEVERALSIAESSRGRVLAERHGVGVPAAASARSFQSLAATTGTTLVSYWLGPDRSFVWVVNASGVRLQTLAPAGEIEPLIRKHQEALHSAVADPLAASGAGEQLRQLLIAPFADTLKPGASLVVVPDGPLHGLNLETLPAPGSPRRYWVEDVEIQVAPSLALLGRPATPNGARSLLAIGNPTPRDPEFPALRYASAEMSSIVRHFGEGASRSYDGPRASPAALRDAGADQFSLVHFTAHATANRESPLDSAVILSGPDDAYKLYAREVAELPLRAELVTVSACRSAGERVYSGEGLVGFAWAFLRAGSRRVIAGLWDVDDRSTAELMDVMYARLAAGDSPPRALRAAKLALLTKGGVTAKPYYWAPFQVFTLTPS
jgi:CHAT domain-containing protein